MPRPDEIVRAIEDEAFLFGWTPDRLYNDFWDRPRGLASVLLDTDSIESIDENEAVFRTAAGHLRRFRRSPVGVY